jgi:hypothetical protein
MVTLLKLRFWQNFDPSTPPACSENLHFPTRSRTWSMEKDKHCPGPAELGWRHPGSLSRAFISCHVLGLESSLNALLDSCFCGYCYLLFSPCLQAPVFFFCKIAMSPILPSYQNGLRSCTRVYNTTSRDGGCHWWLPVQVTGQGSSAPWKESRAQTTGIVDLGASNVLCRSVFNQITQCHASPGPVNGNEGTKHGVEED